MSDDNQTTRRVAIFEQHGRLLEKFQQDGTGWVSLADDRRWEESKMLASGWVYVGDEKR